MSSLRTSVFERARLYLAKLPPANSGERGHDATFRAASTLVHGFALPEYEALTLLREYNQRCQPPWNEHELLHKVKSALLASHAKPRGHLLGSVGCQFERGAFPSRLPFRETLKVKIDPTTAVENFLKGFRCDEVDLWEASPIRPPDDWTNDAIALLESLYRPGERINFVTAFKESTDKKGTTKANPIGNGETVERDELVARWRESGMPKSKAGGW